MTSPDDFSIFFKILVFCVVCGGGGRGGGGGDGKMAKNGLKWQKYSA